MNASSRFKLGEVLHVSTHSRVCRGSSEDGVTVIMKLVDSRENDAQAGALLRHEHQILERLRIRTGEPVLLTRFDGADALIRPDHGGEPLASVLGGSGVPLVEGLRMACAICSTLDTVHRAGVIHKDIKPSNILWHEAREEATLIDFGIAEFHGHGESSLIGPLMAAGTWAYAAPEQSGRMRRAADERADLYALGVTFYQIFSGMLPFAATDVAELIHAHLAVRPVPLCDRVPGIPPQLSAIIDKLLAKEPEHRYQTASGLRADLARCMEVPGANGDNDARFPLGTSDSMEHFDIPAGLYGREAEMETLMEAFDAVRTGAARTVLIAGYSGIGKSALVHHMSHSVIEHRCTFLTGKFDQLRRNVPYATLVQAFQSLIRQMLKDSGSRIEELRGRLVEALGGNLNVIMGVIGELELIVGEQPPAVPLPPAEAHHRLRLALLQFIRVFATGEHPLVLFLDDLQWADAATLEVVELFATSEEITHLLLIGAYRDNEVDETHPLIVMRRRLEKRDAPVTTITLGPVPPSGIRQFLADFMRSDADEAGTLAEICQEKTAGNPFFLVQFLRSLRDQGLIVFSKERGRREWMEELIRAQPVQENVVDLMIQRIGGLPQRAQEVLKTGACIGSSFDLSMVGRMRGASVEELLGDAWSAVKQMLIVPATPTQIHAGHLMGSSASSTPRRFQFIHDRVQQASYALVGAEEKPGLHLRIARLLHDGADERGTNERLFDIVHHFNLGRSLLSDEDEQRTVAELNVRAGARARASAAYQSTRGYLDAALSLLTPARWESDYPLMLQAHCLAAEAAYLCHDFDGMEQLAAATAERARSVLDRARAGEVRIQALMARGEPVAAIRLALPILRELGVSLPANPKTLDILTGMARTEFRLRKFKIEDLLHLPQMTDPTKLAAIRILEHVYSSAYFALPKLYPLIMFTFIRLALKYGNTAASAIGYSAYGVILCGMFRQMDRGYRFGQLSLDLVHQLMATSIKAKVVQVTQGFVTVWKKHPEEVLPSFVAGHHAGLESGDLEFAAYTCHMIGFFNLWMGTPLEQVDAEMRKYTRVIERLQQNTPLYQQKLWHQLTANLLGQAKNPLRMTGEHYDENAMLAVHRAANDEIAQLFLHHCKVTLGLLYDDPREALASIDSGLAFLKNGVGIGSTTVPLFYGFSALVLIAAARAATGQERSRLTAKARALLKPLSQWAKAAPMHGEARHLLVLAELAALINRGTEALSHYQNAIEAARKHRNHLDLAIIQERLAGFYYGIGQAVVGRLFLGEALMDYHRLQMHGVVERLIRQHPALKPLMKTRETSSLITPLTDRDVMNTGTMSMPGGQHGSSLIDVMALVKSTQALSGEIVLSKLLKRLMEIMLENAGADYGLLAMERDGHLFIEARASVDPAEVTVLESLPIDHAEHGVRLAPVGILNYVWRTREVLVLDDATRSEMFQNDHYVREVAPRSVICVPLQHQSRITGLLYLQNTLTSHAFPPDRAFMLRTLSSQAAISIDNARLYGNLEALNRSYTRFVPHEFLEILGKSSILSVELGDQVARDMSVLFSDIKGFTRLSESMSPGENIQFINDYLHWMEPVLHRNQGFIDKYIGDAIMALFPRSAEDAVRAALHMLEELRHFNQVRTGRGEEPVAISIGINTGSLMLGVVGGADRLDTTVISDAVNLASRVEHLTRLYGVSLLITEYTWSQLPQGDRDFSNIRKIDRVIPKGKSTAVDLYEVFSADDPGVCRLKAETLREFDIARDFFHCGRFPEAARGFREILERNPDDHVARHYAGRCTTAVA